LGDFATAAYVLSAGEDSVTLARTGTVWSAGESYPVRVRKIISLAPRASGFEIRYDICNQAERSLSVLFGTEFAVNLLSGSSFDRYYWSEDRDLHGAELGATGCDEGLTHLALRDDWQRLECGFLFAQSARVYRFAIETVSQSEAGQERVYQGSIVVPSWQLTCAPGESATRTIFAKVCSP